MESTSRIILKGTDGHDGSQGDWRRVDEGRFGGRGRWEDEIVVMRFEGERKEERERENNRAKEEEDQEGNTR